LVVVAAVVVVGLAGGGFLLYRAATAPTTSPSVSPSSIPEDATPSTPSPTPGGESPTPSVESGTIEMYSDNVTEATPNETVRLRGTYHGGADTFVQVELRDGATWKAFPQPTKTDRLGRFITHVEIATPGSHWLRVVDPASDVASEPFVLVIGD
jgi:hypothetical protein